MNSNIKTFESFMDFFKKKSKEPRMQYKKERGKYYIQNPSGGDWIEIDYVKYKRETGIDDDDNHMGDHEYNRIQGVVDLDPRNHES